MRRIIRHTFPFFVLLALVMPALAQNSGGQVWVQAFEDRNGSGSRDPGEPFLTSGVSVDLLNADGVIMASGTLDNAPYASQGYIGFYNLSPGSYTAAISSPDLAPTTPDRVTVTITQGGMPVKVDFGAQRAADVETPPAASASSLLNSDLARIALAGFGATLVILVMAFTGMVVYLLVLRPRAPVALKRTTTGSMRAVRVDAQAKGATAEMRRTGENRKTGETERP